MQLGLIGLGKMGGNMRERLRRAGHEVVGFDRNPDVADVRTLPALVKALDAPRVVWVMVPAGDPTRETVAKLAELLEPGDLVIDGGNSRFTDDFENAKLLGEKKIGYVDCGVSGGVWGLENGYGLMCGGDKKWVAKAMPIFDALRPEGPRDEGFVHAGKVGAGHYTKMVHNGIEYGLMAAYAEGYELLEKKDIVTDVPGAFKAWSRGTGQEGRRHEGRVAPVGDEAGEQAGVGDGLEGQCRRREEGCRVGSGLGHDGHRHGRHRARPEARGEEDRQEGLSRAPHPPCTSVT